MSSLHRLQTRTFGPMEAILLQVCAIFEYRRGRKAERVIAADHARSIALPAQSADPGRGGGLRAAIRPAR
jgi:hypothetical protein